MRAATAAMGVLSVLLFGTCTKDEPRREQAASAPRGDGDLRAMVGELAAARACAMLRGQFRELRGRDGAATGVLWIRECTADGGGAKTTFRIVASGWQRGDVRFGVKTTVTGSLDVTYARTEHAARARFTPVTAPDVALSFAGDADVDRAAISASVVGALAGVVTDAPTPARFAEGVSLSIDLCTGAGRFALGTHATTTRATTQVTAVLWPGGLIMAGPQRASTGITVDAEAIQGAVRVGVVCADQAAAIAQRMTEGKHSEVPFLASVDLHARGRLRIPRVTCPVVMVAQSLESAGGPATFTWQRPAADIVQAAEGPLVQCAK